MIFILEDITLIRYIIGSDFCHDRLCPMCSWRRARALGRKLLDVILMNEQNQRFHCLLLTLTIKNCDWQSLGKQIKTLTAGWSRLMRRALFKSAVTGWCRALEITKGQDGLAHPHLHVLLQVPKDYFSSKAYLTHEWIMKTWKSCINADYDPRVDIRLVRQSRLRGAIAEVCKYMAKGCDIDSLNDAEFKAYADAVYKVRAWACGGNFRVSEADIESSLEEEFLHAAHDQGHERCPCCGEALREAHEGWDVEAGEYVEVERFDGGDFYKCHKSHEPPDKANPYDSYPYESFVNQNLAPVINPVINFFLEPGARIGGGVHAGF